VTHGVRQRSAGDHRELLGLRGVQARSSLTTVTFSARDDRAQQLVRRDGPPRSARQQVVDGPIERIRARWRRRPRAGASLRPAEQQQVGDRLERCS